MCTVDIQYATAENRRGKKKKEKRRKKKKKEETTGRKYNGLPYSTGRHKNWKSNSKCKILFICTINATQCLFFYRFTARRNARIASAV